MSSAIADELRAQLRVVAELAQSLRAGGITEISVGAVAFKMAPLLGPQQKLEPVPESSSDPLHDSATYAGGKVPGYTIVPEGKEFWDSDDPETA